MIRENRLNVDGVTYTQIGGFKREPQKGGLFEVYQRSGVVSNTTTAAVDSSSKEDQDIDKSNDDPATVPKPSLQQQPMLFVASGRANLNAPILQTVEQASESMVQSRKGRIVGDQDFCTIVQDIMKSPYVIREKNTIRKANPDEIELLNTLKSSPNTTAKQQQDSPSTTPHNPSSDLSSSAESKPSNPVEPLTEQVIEKFQGVHIDPGSSSTSNSEPVSNIPVAENLAVPTFPPLSTEEDVMNSLMQNSYGRIAMANHRARGRYNELVNSFFNIFDFADGKVPIIEPSNKTISQIPCAVVTLKKDVELPLKKIFEILQVYNSEPQTISDTHRTEQFLSADGNINLINGTVPMLVRLKTNCGVQFEFMLKQPPYNSIRSDSDISKDQILVFTMDENKKAFVSHSYSQYIDSFSNVRNQQLLATIMIKLLTVGLLSENEMEFLKSIDSNLVVEFLAVTQIAEANHGRDNNKSRTPGMNKLARGLLRSIESGASTFEKSFNPDYYEMQQHGINRDMNKRYPPIGKGGTGIARTLVSGITRKFAGNLSVTKLSADGKKEWLSSEKSYKKIDISAPYLATCYDMSDDSDSGDEIRQEPRVVSSTPHASLASSGASSMATPLSGSGSSGGISKTLSASAAASSSSSSRGQDNGSGQLMTPQRLFLEK